MDSTLATRLKHVQNSIHEACISSGRDPQSVRLVAASKTRTADEVRQAMAAGHRLFGENRAQELRDKSEALRFDPSPPQWHFIGALQTNKVRYVVGVATLVHSVDRLALATAISSRAVLLDSRGQLPAPVRVLIQVNIAGEPSKSGVSPHEALDLARTVHALPHVEVAGLMCIPPAADDPEDAAPWFTAVATLAAEGRAAGLPLQELSMGMSHDHAVAIRCGATLVRVGTAIFGAR